MGLFFSHLATFAVQVMGTHAQTLTRPVGHGRYGRQSQHKSAPSADSSACRAVPRVVGLFVRVVGFVCVADCCACRGVVLRVMGLFACHGAVCACCGVVCVCCRLLRLL